MDKATQPYSHTSNGVHKRKNSSNLVNKCYIIRIIRSRKPFNISNINFLSCMA